MVKKFLYFIDTSAVNLTMAKSSDGTSYRQYYKTFFLFSIGILAKLSYWLFVPLNHFKPSLLFQVRHLSYPWSEFYKVLQIGKFWALG